MPETWFISDTHFGHSNILQYEPMARPFKHLDEMHEVMIDKWNNTVAPSDFVFHLGDFCMGKHWLPIAKRLHGKKKLILGNHDTYASNAYLIYFDKLYGVLKWNGCVLTHMPVHMRQLGPRWALNVHGHMHSKFISAPSSILREDPRYFNVSCERHNLTPINADIIKEKMKIAQECEL